ncbi:MAG: EamA family transporter [Flavobacteriales bacterium]|jgi:drug/metabolite transporter (DMT)-like permease|nr:EamA family transporter [Flavobacteriales bacterium]
MTITYKKWLYLLLLSLIWGSSYILIKKGLVGLTPLQVGSLRILFTLSILTIAGFKHLKQIPRPQWRWIVVSGFLGTFFPNYLFAFAETKIDSAIAAVLNGLTPLFTLLFGFFLFGIALKRKKLMGVFVGLIGTFILVLKQIQNTGFENSLYLLLVVISAICYAANVNIIKYRLQGISSLGIALGNFIAIAPPALIIAFNSGVFDLDIQSEEVSYSIGYIIILALFGTALAKVVFNELVSISSPVFSSSITYLLPIVAIFWGVLDGEKLDWLQLVASIVILGGVYLVTDQKKTRPN